MTSRRDFLRTSSRLAALAAVVPRLPSWDPAAVPVIDGLCLRSDRMTDGPAATGLDAFILDVSGGSEVKTAGGAPVYLRTLEATRTSIASIVEALGRPASGVFHATRAAQVRDAMRDRRTAVFFQVQGGGEIVGTELDRLATLRDLGVRIVQLTHHHDNALAGGALEAKPSGLTPRGIEAVERMNALGLIPDLSHASEPTTLDVARATKRPAILSHGAARAIVPSPRCASDAMIRAIADGGGAVGVFMMSFWLTTEPVPTPDHLVAHLRHIIKVGGVEAAAIANDYAVEGNAPFGSEPGDQMSQMAGYRSWFQAIAARGVPGFDVLPTHAVVPELNQIGRMRTIRETLERNRFSSSEIERILGGNWQRVLESTLV